MRWEKGYAAQAALSLETQPVIIGRCVSFHSTQPTHYQDGIYRSRDFNRSQYKFLDGKGPVSVTKLNNWSPYK
ncbi:hypothetical protein DAMNIGENAA_28030 [Desulforhabdus amnigena]|uniref:Uncharacterized protein n=1 Tax=Desulforhabdus amnigena TaxID=40218 RepID=A0A9W6L9M2_9BACT|nr:hypothetical protein DAMNIGENAA_28030 [Desulforhabdus amnigena]